jgi:hypothetical protein
VILLLAKRILLLAWTVQQILVLAALLGAHPAAPGLVRLVLAQSACSWPDDNVLSVVLSPGAETVMYS